MTGSPRRRDPRSLPESTSPVNAAREAATFLRSRAIGGASAEGGGLYRLLVESVRDYAIFALDADGYIVSWNLGAERIKGYAPEEIIGKHFSVFYPDELRHMPPRELEIAAAEGRFEDEAWRLRKDGSRFWANVVITALHDERGELVGFAKVTRDLTQRRAQEERTIEHVRRLAQADAANLAKSDFLAAMSHELRTPLNAIGGYTDLLATGIGGALSEQQRQYLERIRTSQQHLLGIINDILNFVRLEAGQLRYDIEPVPLGEVLDSIHAMIAPHAAAKGLELRCDSGPGVTVHADRVKVEQILLNLLTNAIKFTEPGGRIDITVSVGDRARITVRDTGIGIPAEQLERVFEPFVQIGRSLTSPHEGAGLGLAISRDLATAMDGELEVESTKGMGASFTLSLPVA
jgi:PAS domain S-box-containing protein